MSMLSLVLIFITALVMVPFVCSDVYDFYEVSEQRQVEVPNTARSSGLGGGKRKNLTRFEHVRRLEPWHRRPDRVKNERDRVLSWASKAGLQPYDEILEVNGVSGFASKA